MTYSVHAILDYHPYTKNGQKNQAFNNSMDSKRLLDLKEPHNPKHKAAVTYFGGRFSSFCLKNSIKLSEFDAVAIVPSSKRGEYSLGLHALLVPICKGIVPLYPLLLTRHTTIQSMHNGGQRNPLVHQLSIHVTKDLVNKGGRVLLVDDVTTTGSSFDGCSTLLVNSGISEVVCIAIGQSV